MKNTFLRRLPNNIWKSMFKPNMKMSYTAVLCCDYKATAKGSFRIHTQAKRENIKFQCSKWYYEATTKSSIQIHATARHDNTRYNSKKCNFAVSNKWKLKYHIQAKHRKNCECCCHHSLFKGHKVIVNNVVLNCQQCNQCLKCQV